MEIENFFRSSTIHGFKYLSNKFHWIERTFWIISLLISLILSLILISQLIIKIKTDPIIVVIKKNQISVKDIDFPALTACPGLIETLPEKKGSENKRKVHFKYEKHTGLKIQLEPEEYLEETVDERNLGESKYSKILEKIERNES